MQTNSLEADKFDTHMGLVLFEAEATLLEVGLKESQYESHQQSLCHRMAYFVESARGFAPDSQNGFTFDRF